MLLFWGCTNWILFGGLSAGIAAGGCSATVTASVAAAGIAAAALTGIAAGAVGIFMSAIALTAMVGVAGAFRTFVTAAVGRRLCVCKDW